MAGIYNGPARGGTRGGKDQFSWENVKADQDREYYLGHSVKALAGRWQKNKDVYWYTRDKDDDGAQERQDELRAVKQREEELMLEALGLKPKVPKQLGQATLDKGDMQKLLAKGTDGEEGGGGAFEDEAGPDRVKGLGFAAGARGMIQSGIQQDRLAGVGTAALQGAQGAGREHPARETGPSNAQQQQQGVQAAGAGGGAGLTAEQVKELKRLAKKEERRAAKRAKKEAKKAKKAAKKAKKKAGKEKRKKKGNSRSDSSGPSSSSESDESEDDSAKVMDDGQPPERSVAQQHGLSPRRGLGSRQTGEGLQRGRVEDSRSGRRENSRGGGIRSRSRSTLPLPLRHESRRSSRSPRRQLPGERYQRGVGQHERQHEDGRDGSGRYGERRRGREYSPGRAGQRDRGDRGRSRSRSRERGRGMGRQRHGSP